MISLWLSATRLALRAISRNKLRATLTVLGIMIGVAAVVVMTSLGEGVRGMIADQMRTLGSNIIMVMPSFGNSSGAKTTSVATLTYDDAAAIGKECPSVAGSAPMLVGNFQAVFMDRNHLTRVYGSTSDYFKVRDWAIDKGRYWTESEERTGARVCVIGATIVKEVYGASEPLDTILRVGKTPCKVIGVLAVKGQSTMGNDQDDAIVISLKTYTGHIASKARHVVDFIMISATDEATTTRAEEQVKSLLTQRHRIAADRDPDFRVQNMQEIQTTFQSVLGMLELLLLCVAAIALVVGGIGVMNIMLVSVTERTPEIGIRMAIGARQSDILVQFLLEAVVLSLLGGIAGSLSGIGLIAIASIALSLPMALQPLPLVIALSVSAGIGVIFGFFPARTAARLDPIEALRRE